MSAIPAPDRLDTLYARLGEFAGRRRLVAVLAGLATWSAVSLGLLATTSLIVGLTAPATPIRYLFLFCWIAVPLAAAAVLIVMPLLRRCNDEELARAIEEATPGLDNALINAVQLARQEAAASNRFLRRAIDEAAARAARLDVATAVSRVRLRRAALALTCVIAAAGLLALLAGAQLRQGAASILRPRAFVPRIGSVRIASVRPGDVDAHLVGDPLMIRVKLHGAVPDDAEARVFLTDAAGVEAAHDLVPLDTERSEYAYTLDAVMADLSYRVEIGGTQSVIYTVAVRERIIIDQLGAVFEFPHYTGLTRREVAPLPGALEGPQGAQVTLYVKTATPAAAARLLKLNGVAERLNNRGDGLYFSTRITLTADDAYAVAILDSSARLIDRRPLLGADSESAGESDAPPGYYPINVHIDAPPTVECLSPARDVTAAPGQTVKMRFTAHDDWGLTKLEIRARHAENDPSRLLAEMSSLDKASLTPGDDAGQSALIEHKFIVDPKQFNEGDVITYWAVALDNRELPGVGGPQASSDTDRPPTLFRIIVRDQKRVERERARRLEQLTAWLRAILETQITARAATVELEKFAQANQLSSRRRQSAGIVKGQKAVSRGLQKLVSDFPFDADMLDLKQAIALLTVNDAQTAYNAAVGLKQIADADPLAEAARALARVQSRIIDALRTMLALALQADTDNVEGRISRLGGDLPPEQAAALQDLLDALRDFIDQQRHIIETTRNLAKRPVDNFSDDELAQLEQLALAEDDWFKFLEEKITDLSKLNEQDFSNASLLKELIEIQDDVVMARGALEKKAIEIAVPLEESGLELAETLEMHLEKWLPDEPDRIKWSMEEPLEQTDVPMAELPDELEDLIGELLEQEEDLYEEIDDVTSKWTDSLDKGAGWDALDGPISNMSAQGVTGNQLPNTSEISGRSGEGRTGRASGEMVEESATGKGGRRTPTRLAPDPFQKGQINDSSTEPPGGATGGGKLAGLAGEGLEGPVPAEIQQHLARLARRQAELRTKGEKVDLRFRVLNYRNFKLAEAIRMMRRNESDLANYRYRNVLRRRNELLDALNTQRMLLGGEIMVKTDATPPAVKQLRDDIADVRESEMPPGFADLLRKYYERLSSGDER